MEKELETLMFEIDSHIFESAREGYTGCGYEFGSETPNYLMDLAIKTINETYGYKVKRDSNVINIDWSDK